MQPRLIVLLGIQVLVIGFILGFLGSRHYATSEARQDGRSKGKSPPNLGLLSDEDFLESYAAQKKSLPPKMQVLGDRLFECLVDKEDGQSQKTDTYRFLGDSEKKPSKSKIQTAAIPKGQFVPFAFGGAEVPPSEVPNARLLTLFPTISIGAGVETENFGVVSGAVMDMEKFLKDSLCNTPSFAVIDDESRNQSNFFRSVENHIFDGNIEIANLDPKKKGQTFVTNMEISGEGPTFLQVGDGNPFMEKRAITQNSGAAWRFNQCKGSVVMVSDSCPWNSKFALEYKDFFVLPDAAGELIGNVYCKNISDTSWTRVGHFKFGRTS